MISILGDQGPPPAKPAEVYSKYIVVDSKYIVVDRYAKAGQGMKAGDAVKWAAGGLGKIYG